MDILSRLKPPPGAVGVAIRVGRGVGSGIGKTSGRGQKGQKARSTGNINKKHFQGGQTPLYRRLPKRGFKNNLGDIVAVINVADLEAAFESGAEVGLEALAERGLVRGRFDKLKILGDGDLTKKLVVSAHAFSRSAAEKIERAGGRANVLKTHPNATPAS